MLKEVVHTDDSDEIAQKLRFSKRSHSMSFPSFHPFHVIPNVSSTCSNIFQFFGLCSEDSRINFAAKPENGLKCPVQVLEPSRRKEVDRFVQKWSGLQILHLKFLKWFAPDFARLLHFCFKTALGSQGEKDICHNRGSMLYIIYFSWFVLYFIYVLKRDSIKGVRAKNYATLMVFFALRRKCKCPCSSKNYKAKTTVFYSVCHGFPVAFFFPLVVNMFFSCCSWLLLVCPFVWNSHPLHISRILCTGDVMHRINQYFFICGSDIGPASNSIASTSTQHISNKILE